MFELFKPETVVGLAGLSLVLLWLIIGAVRGWYVPGTTHRREVASLEKQVTAAREDRDAHVDAIRAEMATRMENFRADHALRLQQIREDHEKQLEGQRSDRDALLTSKQRDADDWRAAFHLSDENRKIADENRRIAEERLEEVVESSRLILAFFREWPRPANAIEPPPTRELEQ